MLLYRGLSKDRGQKIVAGTEAIAATSNGELGAGSYYWKETEGSVALFAAVISALQYYGSAPGGWALLAIDIDENSVVYREFLERETTLDFSDGAKRTVHYETVAAVPGVSSRQMASIHPMKLEGFVELNEQPGRVNSSAAPKMIPWMHYPMILGPTVAAAANDKLTQIKFNGAGLTLLNTAAVAKKRLVVTGDAYQSSNAQVKSRIDAMTLTSPKTSVRNGFPRILAALDPMPATTQDLRATWLQTS